MMLNTINPNVDYLKDNELISVKRRMMERSESDCVKIRGIDTNDLNKESIQPQNVNQLEKHPFDSMSAVDILNHTINSPNIPLKYKDEKQKQVNQAMENPIIRRQFIPMHGYSTNAERSNFTPLAIRNDHIYKLKNSACSCPLQGINYKYMDDMISQITSPVKSLCPIHSGHPIHESIRIGIPKDSRSVFGSGQSDSTILLNSHGEKIIIVKELSLTCKYRMIPSRKVHILYILSLLSSTNQVSMFQLSSPLQAMSYVFLKDLNLQQYSINNRFKSTTYNGPALFIATTDEFRIATMPDSLGNTKGVMNQKYISRMHIILRQRNYGVSVSKILCHEITGRIFIFDTSNNVYEFVYQYRTPSHTSMSFAFLKPLKTLWNYIYAFTQYTNSLLNMRGDVMRYTVNPVEITVAREEFMTAKPLNHSCLNTRLDRYIKNSVLYYPPMLWEAITPEVIARLKTQVPKNVCNCGAVDPCMSMPINYTLKTLNPWYLYRSVRSNSTIIDGFVDKVKNILVVLFLNGDVIVYPLSNTIEDDKDQENGYIIKGDQIQNYLYRMNYHRFIGSVGYINRDLKKYHTISMGSKSDEMVANGQNVVAVLSDEYGTRIYIGFNGGYTTASDGSLVRVVNEGGGDNVNSVKVNINPTLVVKGFRMMPPYFSPEGFTSENSENHMSDMYNMHRTIHKTYRIDENEYAIVQVGFKENYARKMRSKPLFDPSSSVSPFGAMGYNRDRIDSGPCSINPLTGGPIISNTPFVSAKPQSIQGSINMYKITIAIRDKDTFSEVSADDQCLSRTIWNSLNNKSGFDVRNNVKQVEWYDQFYLYLGIDERLVSMFMNGSSGKDSLGNLMIITTFHVYNIQRQSLYTLMEDAINNPITALEAYDKKALNYFPKWLESAQNNKSKLPKFSNMTDLKVSKEVDILDIAANKKYLNRDPSDQLKISEMQCVGFLFYLFSWVYSPQVFFSVVWKLLVNSNAIASKNVNLKHYCSNLIFPEYTNDVRLSLMCTSLGIYSKQYNWSVFTMEDKIYPWPKMLYFGSTTYYRAAKISTNAISPIVEGLLLLISELFEDIWVLKLFPPYINQFARIAYKMLGRGQEKLQKSRHKLLVMLKDYFTLQPNYKKLYDQLESLSELLKISIVCNSRDTFKEAICDALSHQILDDYAHNWQDLIATDIITLRSKLIKCERSASDDLFGSKLLTRSNKDVDQEYLELKNEFTRRFDKDISLLNECNTLMTKAKTYLLGAIIFQCCITDFVNINKFINVYETSQKLARVDYTLFSLEKISSDVVYEKEFNELVKNVKKAFNIT